MIAVAVAVVEAVEAVEAAGIGGKERRPAGGRDARATLPLLSPSPAAVAAAAIAAALGKAAGDAALDPGALLHACAVHDRQRTRRMDVEKGKKMCMSNKGYFIMDGSG